MASAQDSKTPAPATRSNSRRPHAEGSRRSFAYRNRRAIRKFAELAAFAVLAVVVLFPLYFIFTTALKTTQDTFAYPPEFLFTPTLMHFQEIFADGAVVSALWNSTVIATSSTFIAALLGVPAAYALARVEFRGRDQLWFWYITNRFISPIVVALPFFLMMRTLGLLDTRTGLIIVYLVFNVPLMVWLSVDQFRSIPIDLDESALVDGAGTFRTFRSIALPLAAPGIAVAAILCFIFSWNEFLFALVLTRSNAVTAPVEAAGFMTGFGVRWGAMMATGTLIVLPVLIFAAIASRHIVRGLTMGSVKG
jgi:multiple sugar transport system permease protein